MKTFLGLLICFSMSSIANTQFVNYRQLLIFGKEAQPALVKKQMELFDRDKAGIAERDIKITLVPTGNEIHKKYKAKEGAFTIILVGKDGGEKHRTHAILQSQELFSIIDAMPMRRSEMRKND